MQSIDDVKTQLLEFLIELMPHRSFDLSDDTALRTTGLIDSMGMLQIVSFVEERFGIQVEPDETRLEHFDRVADIAAFVHRKQSE